MHLSKKVEICLSFYQQAPTSHKKNVNQVELKGQYQDRAYYPVFCLLLRLKVQIGYWNTYDIKLLAQLPLYVSTCDTLLLIVIVSFSTVHPNFVNT